MRTVTTLALVLITAAAFAQTRTLKVIPPPPDVATPPADAAKTSSGLASDLGKERLYTAPDRSRASERWNGSRSRMTLERNFPDAYRHHTCARAHHRCGFRSDQNVESDSSAPGRGNASR